jgi:LPS sulfotransferase NodH
MEKTLRKFSSKEESRAETYRYWRSRPDAEVFDAIAEMSEQAWNAWYKMHGITPNVERSDRSLTRIPHAPRH